MTRRSLTVRIYSRIVIVALRVSTFITGLPRVRVIVTNEKGQLLLIRPIVSHGTWAIPGGGAKRNEPLETAARRELFEETGIDIQESDMVFIRTLEKPDIDIPFVAPLFRTTAHSAALPKKVHNPREVHEAKWFDLDKLPSPLSRIVVEAVKELRN